MEDTTIDDTTDAAAGAIPPKKGFNVTHTLFTLTPDYVLVYTHVASLG